MQLSEWTFTDSNKLELHGYESKATQTSKLESSTDYTLHYLHGTGFSSLCLAELARQLPQTWTHRFCNAPGHGKSEQPSLKTMPDWVSMADSVAESIKNRYSTPIVGIGHSFGGVLTLIAASKNPHLFSRIILFDPVIFIPTLILYQSISNLTGLWRYIPLSRKVAKRKSVWRNKQTMKDELNRKALYKQWPSVVMDDFIQSGTKHLSDNTIALACKPQWEAALFGSYPKQLWKHIKNLTTQTDIVIPDNSIAFIPSAARKAVKINSNIKIYWPNSNAFINHGFPMEQPNETAAIIEQLLHQ